MVTLSYPPPFHFPLRETLVENCNWEKMLPVYLFLHSKIDISKNKSIFLNEPTYFWMDLLKLDL